jgi:hypothetical protein
VVGRAALRVAAVAASSKAICAVEFKVSKAFMDISQRPQQSPSLLDAAGTVTTDRIPPKIRSGVRTGQEKGAHWHAHRV